MTAWEAMTVAMVASTTSGRRSASGARRKNVLVAAAGPAMNLALDFDFIEKGAEQKLPKGMEWYAAFGLLITLVWLYLELLRLLSKLNQR